MNFTGFPTDAIQPHELAGREISRKAAAEGMVLLKNEDALLPIKAGSRVGLYGSGAVRTIKGGTGAGDVNERSSVTIYEGLKNAGYVISSERWIGQYHACYQKKREVWKQAVLKQAEIETGFGFFDAYTSVPFLLPAGPEIPEGEALTDGADTAFYVLARIAGEAADRRLIKGDYYLTDEERQHLAVLCRCYRNVVLVINSGGIVDLSVLDEEKTIKAVLYCCQPGMEGGNAFADVVSGKVTPGGKLTDSWAYRYEDYPCAEEFSYLDQNTEKEYYREGIYVGYRYFDTFDIPVRYSFGYGLSYTEFALAGCGAAAVESGCGKPEIRAAISVENAGKCYAGKTAVELYAVLPPGKLKKESRRLVSFGKSKVLQPKERQKLEVSFPVERLASYDEKNSQWILEPGKYILQAGTSLDTAEAVAVLVVSGPVVTEKASPICPLQDSLELLDPADGLFEKKYQKYLALADSCPVLELSLPDSGKTKETAAEAVKLDCKADKTMEASRVECELDALVDSLSVEQLIRLATGDPDKGEDNIDEDALPDQVGTAGISVPGSAGETSDCASEEPWNIPTLVLADGPAGLRINSEYDVLDGKICYRSYRETVDRGTFSTKKRIPGAVRYYQYCTAMPVGTMLAQTFDEQLIEETGRAVAREMRLFGVQLWLAPGMNIHRNPLCGRNFEYYSEDPVLTGTVAAAMTRGVQSVPGCGTTIKHFACNNQEDNRLNVDSILNERTLREIYLKGFEIAVKEAQPMAIMTSYNMVNGVHAANSRDLCTVAAREEWGFKGLIMTDWLTTSDVTVGECTAAGCIRAGNDLIMPGIRQDQDNIREELEKGSLTVEQLKSCVKRVVRAAKNR